MFKQKKALALALSSFLIAGMGLVSTPALAYQSKVESYKQNDTYNNIINWKAIPGATKYRVQVSNDSSFSRIIESGESTGLEYSIKRPLSNLINRNVYWRADAYVDSKWVSGQINQIYVSKVNPPAVSQKETNYEYPNRPVFSWSKESGINHYVVEYSQSSSFLTKYTETVQENFFIPTQNLSQGKWYWRVKSVLDNNGYTPRVDEVSTDWSNTGVVNIRWAKAPELVSPKNNLVSSERVFEWKEVPGAKYYSISISKDEDFTNNIVNNEVVEGLRFTYDDTLANGDYYWKVTPYDINNVPGVESEIFKFDHLWVNDTNLNKTGKNLVTTITGSESNDIAKISEKELLLEWEPFQKASAYEIRFVTKNGNQIHTTMTTPNLAITQGSRLSTGNLASNIISGSSAFITDDHINGQRGIKALTRSDNYVFGYQVRAINGSSKSLNNAPDRENTSRTEWSQTRYLQLDESKDFDEISKEELGTFLDDASLSAQYKTDIVVTESSPVFTWDHVENAASYEVGFYRTRNDNDSVIAKYETPSNVFVLNGTFKNDNTSSSSYYVRVIPRDSNGRNIHAGEYFNFNDLDIMEWKRILDPIKFTKINEDLIEWENYADVEPRSGGSFGYELQYKKSGNSTWNDRSVVTHRVEGNYWAPAKRIPAGTYDIRVRALNGLTKDETVWSNVEKLVVRPNQVNGVKVSQIDDVAFVKWNDKINTKAYQIQMRLDGGKWNTIGTTNNNSFAYPIGKGFYEFQVLSVPTLSNDESIWSQTVSLNRNAARISMNNPRTMFYKDRRITWGSVKGASYYKIGHSDTNTNFTPNSRLTKTSRTSWVTEDKVSYGTTYYYKVFAFNNNDDLIGESDTRMVAYQTLPTVKSTQVSKTEYTRIYLTFPTLTQKELGSNEKPKYIVRYKPLGSTDSAWKTYDTNKNSFVISGLKANTSYDVQSAVKTSQGQSSWSRNIVVTTAKAKAPSQITSSKVTKRKVKSLDISWGVPANNGSAIKSYTVHYKAKSDRKWKKQTVKTNKVSLKKLKQNKEYEYYIIANNSISYSSKSKTFTGKTLALPGKPGKVKATSKKKSVTLTWKKSSNGSSKVIGYDIYQKKGKRWVKVKTVKSNKLTHSKLKANKKYSYKIRAKSKLGTSSWSKTITVKTKK